MSVLRRFFGAYQNWLAVLILFDYVALALLAPVIAPKKPPAPNYTASTAPPGALFGVTYVYPQPPSLEHPLGTLPQAVDILTLIIQGTRQAVLFSVKAAGIAAIIGVLLGAASAYLGGVVNAVVMRLADGMLAIPMITALVMIRQVQVVLLSRYPTAFVFDPNYDTLQAAYNAAAIRIFSFDAVMWAIIFVSWIPFARITHAMVITLGNMDFVQAARALGASAGRVILLHLIPNAISPSIVMLARDLGWAVILQASLNFAGFGGDSIWGGILVQGRDRIIGAGGNPFGYWWVWLPATLALVVYGVAWNVVGDGLNNALNPRETVIST